MNYLSKAIFGTTALVAALASAVPAYAECRGFGCSLVQGIPIIGPAAQAVDQGIAGIKDRGSDADVLHQGTSLNDLGFNNPIGQPRGGRPSLGNRCGTPVGIFAPGPWQPVGTPCHGNGPYGPVPCQVIQ
jgi:hypothetical protein